ncbi:MAG: pilus assembly protein N-terminal domain-containing protein, partial [Planctomycetota bacterium]
MLSRPLHALLAVALAAPTAAPPAVAQVTTMPPAAPQLTASAPTQTAAFASPSVVRKITGSSDKLEITTNTSRILTLGKKVPKVQVNNPELLAVTPLTATEIQVSAKKAGVTQVNLWDEDGKIHTVDVFIYGDVRELEYALQTQFPNSSVKVYRYSQSLVLTGFIDRPDYVDPIRQLAEDYAPKVINNIAVGGVQQVLLKVRIYEVSRTKLRKLGTDIGHFSDGGGYFGTSVSGLISNIGDAGANPIGIATTSQGVRAIADTAGQTVEFAITDGTDAFLGAIDALQQKNVA